MKNLRKRIIKIFAAMGIFFVGIWNKVVFAKVEIPLPIRESPAEYGVIRPTIGGTIVGAIWGFLKIFLIPILLIIGLIVYWKKSNAEKNKKRNIVIATIIITAILYAIYLYWLNTQSMFI